MPKYGYEEKDKITRYHILWSIQGTETAKGYLEQNLEVDELRLILIQEDMAKGDYAHAEHIYRERLKKERENRGAG